MEVAPEIDPGQEVAEDGLDVVHVETWIVLSGDDEEVLRERGLAEPENGVRAGEDLARLALFIRPIRNVALASDREKQRMDSRGVDRVEGLHAGERDGNHRLGQLVNELSERGVLLGRPPYDGEGPDRVIAMVDRLDLENGKLVSEAVVPEVIAERPLGQAFGSDRCGR